MRKQHLLAAAHGGRYPSQLVALDVDGAWQACGPGAGRQCESLVGWAAQGVSGSAGTYKPPVCVSGSDASSFWAALRPRLRRQGAVWIVSQHATRCMALLGLWQALEGGEAILASADHRAAPKTPGAPSPTPRGACVLEDPPTIVDFRLADCAGTAHWIDSANWALPQLPADAGAADRVRQVLQRTLGLIALMRREGMGGLSSTVASQALSAWRHGRVGCPVLIHDTPAALRLESEALYGGRCECFSLGPLPGRIAHVDVTGMYPYCYTNHPLPVSLRGCAEEVGQSDCEELAERYALIADVTLYTNEPAYPYRDSQLGLTVWPIGEFRTTLCWPELEDAVKAGRVVAWHRAAWYDYGRPLRPFGELILRLRKELNGETGLQQWAKALGVSVVGKLAQRERRWLDATTDALYPPWLAWYVTRGEGHPERWRSIAGHAQREELGGWTHDACPQMAAWITSLARRRLLAMIRTALWSNVYYCDTDSIMVSARGLDRLTDGGCLWPGEPGYLRVVSENETVVLRGIKSYSEDGRDVCAGRPVRPEARGTDGHTFWLSLRARTACQEQRRPTAERVARPFEPSALYRHGRRGRDGRVEPLVYGRSERV